MHIDHVMKMAATISSIFWSFLAGPRRAKEEEEGAVDRWTLPQKLTNIMRKQTNMKQTDRKEGPKLEERKVL